MAAVKTAITDVAVPYLEKVKDAMQGAFDYTLMRDTDKEVASIHLEIGRRTGIIKFSGTNLQCTIRDTNTGKFDPYLEIQSADDISDESIGQFIKAIMDS